MHLNLGALKALTSDLAQAIYLYLPSRAFHHTGESVRDSPGGTIGTVGHASAKRTVQKKELFTQHKRSALSQLDGAEILRGKLRVALAPAGDGSDYKLLSWVEKGYRLTGAEPPEGPLFQAWIASGRSRDEYEKHKINRQPLADYEEELLRKAGVILDTSHSFFSIGKNLLLGENRFDALISEAKAEALERPCGQQSPDALIIGIIRAIQPSAPQRGTSRTLGG